MMQEAPRLIDATGFRFTDHRCDKCRRKLFKSQLKVLLDADAGGIARIHGARAEITMPCGRCNTLNTVLISS
jgi:hypothetical protein